VHQTASTTKRQLKPKVHAAITKIINNEILHRGSGPQKQDRVCLGWKSDDLLPYFATIFFTPV